MMLSLLGEEGPAFLDTNFYRWDASAHQDKDCPEGEMYRIGEEGRPIEKMDLQKLLDHVECLGDWHGDEFYYLYDIGSVKDMKLYDKRVWRVTWVKRYDEMSSQ